MSAGLLDSGIDANKYVLVTGGTGYIGSHTVLELLLAGFHVVVLDNLSNSSPNSIAKVTQVTQKQVIARFIDLVDIDSLRDLFSEFEFVGVLHFAGLKSVSKSINEPLSYYENNVVGTVNLLVVMEEFKVEVLVFSSSATVYGDAGSQLITESQPTNPINPYGRTKLIVEQLIRDYAASRPSFSAALLRYFNPIGAHDSGLLGENPKDTPNNLVPCILRAIKENRPVSVYGSDYNTSDGTAIRDYIHVVDLAKGHIAALEFLFKTKGCHVFNMGNGKGFTVLQVIKELEIASGLVIPFGMKPRRDGDAEKVVADPSLAFKVLSWKPSLSLADMCCSAWKYHQIN